MSLGSDVCTADELLGSYALVSQLAAGHLTTLHRAHAAGSSGAALVIKRLLYSHVHELADRELLLAAGRAGMRVRSPNVVRVLAVHEDPEPFVVMEHVQGVMLSTLLAETLDQEVLRYVFPILVDVLEGLEVLHGLRGATGASASLVHGAPSARHILIGDDGVARLIDLTHATGSGFSVAARRSLRLLPAEMAPEQVLAPMHVDARCDLFIVGTVLWRALTGQPLFEHPQREEALQQLLRKPILAPSEAGSLVETTFDRVCMRALSRARAERYASAAEMARELKAEAQRASLYAARDEIASLVRTLLLANQDAEEEGALLVTTTGAGEEDARGPARLDETSPGSEASDALDVLTVHHQGSSRFGFAESSLSLKGVHELADKPAPVEARASVFCSRADPRASVPGQNVAARASAHDVLPTRGPAREQNSEAPERDAAERGPARESGTWYEGLPSIFPGREEPRNTAPFWLWGAAAAVALLGSVLIDNPPWQSAQRLREQQLETAGSSAVSDDERAVGSGNYAALFAGPRSSVASSALPPRAASADAPLCLPSEATTAPPTAEAQASEVPAAMDTIHALPALAAPRPRAAKPFLSPLPPNPY
jgi:hypothetical protein